VSLLCIECGDSTTQPERGWRAYMVEDVRGDDPDEVVVCCPDCAAREFGSRMRGDGSARD
jgi:hypothetical protein